MKKWILSLIAVAAVAIPAAVGCWFLDGADDTFVTFSLYEYPRQQEGQQVVEESLEQIGGFVFAPDNTLLVNHVYAFFYYYDERIYPGQIHLKWRYSPLTQMFPADSNGSYHVYKVTAVDGKTVTVGEEVSSGNGTLSNYTPKAVTIDSKYLLPSELDAQLQNVKPKKTDKSINEIIKAAAQNNQKILISLETLTSTNKVTLGSDFSFTANRTQSTFNGDGDNQEYDNIDQFDVPCAKYVLIEPLDGTSSTVVNEYDFSQCSISEIPQNASMPFTPYAKLGKVTITTKTYSGVAASQYRVRTGYQDFTLTIPAQDNLSSQTSTTQTKQVEVTAATCTVTDSLGDSVTVRAPFVDGSANYELPIWGRYSVATDGVIDNETVKCHFTLTADGVRSDGGDGVLTVVTKQPTNADQTITVKGSGRPLR